MAMTGCNTSNAWNIIFLLTKLQMRQSNAQFLLVLWGRSHTRFSGTLSLPEKPTDVSFKNLVSAMTSHFSPPPLEIIQRFRFNSQVRKPGETVAACIAELKALSEYCKFGDTLESMLCGRLVRGVNDYQIQKRLLEEDKLTFKKALEISLALETATKDTKQLQGVTSASSAGYPAVLMHKLQEGKKPPQHVKCYRCGKANHKAPECRTRMQFVLNARKKDT